MRTLILLLAFFSFCARLAAGEQLIAVTPQTLGDWSVVGADKSSLTHAAQVSLPANAQLFRTFSSGAVLVQLASHPTFSAASSDWPILEVGPLALAYMHSGEQDSLVVVIGQDRQAEFPSSAATDPAGGGVNVVLGYDPASQTGVIKIGDDIHYFSAASATASTDVVLTAGNHSPWPQDKMTVLALSADSAEPVTAATPASSTKPAEANDLLLTGLAAIAKPVAATSGPSAAVSPGTTPPTPAVVSPAPVMQTMEIFTPPSVRLGRADQVRTILAQTSSK